MHDVHQMWYYVKCIGYVDAMMYECEMYVSVRENKSLTAAMKFWEVKSLIVVGDEEYAYLQTLLKGCFHLENIS